MPNRWIVVLLLCLGCGMLSLAQEANTKGGKTEAAQEAFAEKMPLREAAFAAATYNAKQQKLREHYLEVPVGPLPPARQGEAAPLPPPATTTPRLTGEAGLSVNVVQNHPLTDTETSNATSTVCEPSLAVRGQEILVTGNWFAAFSRDGGSTYQYRNPYTMFPAIPGRSFCCDQVALYVPSHDLMVWFLQHSRDSTGNTIRLAVAHGNDIREERWRYYDFTPQGVGNWSQQWFDYPDLGVTARSLFVTTNCFNMSNRFQRSVVLKFSLDELRSYAALNYRHFDRTDVGSLRLTQGAGGTMYIGSHLNLGALRVFSWADGADSFQTKDFTVQPWVRGGATCPGPDGRDWLGFVDGRITAAWAAGPHQGFAWTSAQGGTFARPHVRAAVIDWAAGSVVRQPHIWNADVAFAYPAAAVNSESRVGISLAYGGNTLHPSHSVGALKPDYSWALAATATGTNGPDSNRWGDYMSVRTNGQRTSRFACTGFSLSGGPAREAIVPRVVQFDVVPDGESGPRLSPPLTESAIVRPSLRAIGSDLRRVLEREKPARFSKAARGFRAFEAALNESRREMSGGGRRTVLSLVKGADLESYTKAAKLRPAYSFFYDPPETVCLPDDRLQVTDTADLPWNINCQLIITFQDDSQAVGTGWLLGPRLVVTAGHCVHEGEGGNFFKSVEVIPGMNGATRPFGSVVSTKFRASQAWRTNGTQSLDYGAILLPTPILTAAGVAPGNLSTRSLTDAEFAGQTLTISGYPADKLFGTQWRDTGPVGTILPARLAYSIDTYGGHSGSAVVTTVGGERVAVGIHNYGGCPNRCTRINAAVKADLDAWLAESTAP